MNQPKGLKFFASVFMLSLLGEPGWSQSFPKKDPPKLPEHLMDAAVTITTDSGAGSGFIAKFKGKFFVFTNQHVIDNAKSVKIRNHSGDSIIPDSLVAAYSVDIALLGLSDYDSSKPFFELAENSTTAAKAGDEVIVLGNSLGDGVITATPGKLLNFGPRRVEVDNPVFPGNSGSPIFHVESGLVIGVLTEATTLNMGAADRVTKESFKNADSQVKSETRYFGHRIDSVEKWGAVDWNQYQKLSNYLAVAHDELLDIGDYLFGSGSSYQDFKDLDRAVNEAREVLGSDRFATAERVKAIEEFHRVLRSLSERRIRHLDSASNDNVKPFYIQSKKLDEIREISEFFASECDIYERDLDHVVRVIQKGG